VLQIFQSVTLELI